MVVYGGIAGKPETGGQNPNIIPHSNTSGLRLAGVNSTFSGIWTVTSNLICNSV